VPAPKIGFSVHYIPIPTGTGTSTATTPGAYPFKNLTLDFESNALSMQQELAFFISVSAKF
jgi:hypothetical protein